MALKAQRRKSCKENLQPGRGEMFAKWESAWLWGHKGSPRRQARTNQDEASWGKIILWKCCFFIGFFSGARQGASLALRFKGKFEKFKKKMLIEDCVHRWNWRRRREIGMKKNFSTVEEVNSRIAILDVIEGKREAQEVEGMWGHAAPLGFRV